MNTKEELLKQYNEYLKMNLSIDMTRGKPSKKQLELSMPMLDVLNSKCDLDSIDHVDTRNYGVYDGLKECKELFASILEVEPEDVIIFGNSSLNIMYECLADAFLYGVCGETPWSKLDNKIKWLCPVPGYDRHFAICEQLGIEMINIPIHSDGPDMDMIEELIKDPSVKGIFCIPKYSNPTGITYSQEVVDRFAKLKPCAKDFRIYWDNAYCVHDFYKDDKDYLPSLLREARKYHNEDIVYMFTSTSKITFPGSGVAAFAASKHNLDDIKSHLKYKTIGYDKINELRHVRFLKDINGVHAQMEKHAELLRPIFDYVDKRLEQDLKGLAIWNKPKGGYFISLYVPNKAREVINRCKECGVKLTDMGCAYPYHIDKSNSHIRLAPSCLTLEELKLAMDVIVLSVKIELTE